jgi:hypothetical protein
MRILGLLVATILVTAPISLALPAQPSSGSVHPIEGRGEIPMVLDITTCIDANSIKMFVTNLGVFAYDPSATDPGLEYPKASGKSCSFAAGLWVGAKVGGSLRVALGIYTPEFSPGPIDEFGNYPDPSDTAHKVYKIAKGDTLSPDYVNWPSDLGAPVDGDGNPEVVGEQTLWCVYNDANPDRHDALEGGTDPLGLEVQQTAYAFSTSGALGNVVFMEFRIINDLSNTLDSTYTAIWCDSDIGSFSDDVGGCDMGCDLGFAYNGTAPDGIYGSNPPALGFDLLKGPVGDGGSELPMTAFRAYESGLDPTTPSECYNLMKGLGIGGNPLVDPTTGDATSYQYRGDPVAGTGWLDLNPDDKRVLISAGPFTMEPGDTQHIAIAIVVGRGSDRLESVRTMKSCDRVAQISYDNGFRWPTWPRRDVKITGSPPVGTGPGADMPATAGELQLRAYPNPSAGAVSITCALPSTGPVRLTVHNIAGQAVRTLVDRIVQGGIFTSTWDGCNDRGERVPAGIYFVTSESRHSVAKAKIVLLK